MIDIQIIPALPRHARQIREVQKVTWLATYPNKELDITEEDILSKNFEAGVERTAKRIIENGNIKYWVALEKEIVVGYCIAAKEEEVNRIEALYVHPEFQDKGIGSKLMIEALQWLGNDKTISVTLATYNEKAKEFYRTFGFRESGKEIFGGAEILPNGKRLPILEMILENQETSHMLE